MVVLGVFGQAFAAEIAEVGRHVDGPASFGGDGVPVVLVGGVVHVVLPLELWGDGPRGGVGLSMPMAMTRAAVCVLMVSIRSASLGMFLGVTVVARLVGRVFVVASMLGARSVSAVAMASGRRGSVVVMRRAAVRMLMANIQSVPFDMFLGVATVASVVGRVFGVPSVLGARFVRVVVMASGRGRSVVVRGAALVLVLHVAVMAVVSFLALGMSL